MGRGGGIDTEVKFVLQRLVLWDLTFISENRSRSRHNVEGFFVSVLYFGWPNHAAFLRYNENFTLGRDFYVAYFVRPEISKNN